MTGQLLQAALLAAARGWRVFPLAPGHKTPRRQLTDWESKATCDPARISRWWDRHPTDNIGLATGPSGLVVVDLDAPKAGDEPTAVGESLFLALADAAGDDPGTWTVETPSGGRHLYYQAPTHRRLRNTAGRIGPRIDTRAWGGYVVAAGSIVDGHGYRATELADVAPLPAWLLEALDPPPPPAHPRRPAPRARGYVQSALSGEIQRVLDAGPGCRNDTLNRAAWSLGRLVAQGVLPRPVVESALQAAAEAAGLTPTEATATIHSALDARQRQGAAT